MCHMQVKHLLEALSKMDPEDHICALVYDKSLFDFAEDDDIVLTKEAWEKLCNDFDEQPFDDIFQSIMDGALDYAEDKTDA